MNKIILILILIIVLIIITAGYFILVNKPKAPAPKTVVPEIQSNTIIPDIPEAKIIEKVPSSAIKEITVIGTEFAFNPSKINLIAGEKVKLIFQNNGKAPHNFIMDGLNIGTSVIGGGKTEIIEFNVPDAGTYSFICSVPGHRPAGMEGILVVE